MGFQRSGEGQYVLVLRLRGLAADRISGGDHVADGQWLYACNHICRKPGLVPRFLSESADVVGLSFLLGAPAAASAVPVPAAAL